MNGSRFFRAIILGAPGSGKGTISNRITKKFTLEHICSGDLIRLNLRNNTEFGREAKSYINQGLLVPDELIISFMNDHLSRFYGQSWLLDGYPRTKKQAESLWMLYRPNIVMNLHVPFDIIIDRIKGRYIHMPSGRIYNLGFNAPIVEGKDDVTGEKLVQREDDKPEAVRKRLQIYKEMTKPVIEFYNNKGILKDFRGKETNEIWPRIEQYLDELCCPQKSVVQI